MGRCKKKISNRANGEVRGLHTSFGASEKKKEKAAEETGGGKIPSLARYESSLLCAELTCKLCKSEYFQQSEIL